MRHKKERSQSKGANLLIIPFLRVLDKILLALRLQQAEEEIERLKKVEPLLRKELDICQEVSQYLLFLFLAIYCSYIT